MLVMLGHAEAGSLNDIKHIVVRVNYASFGVHRELPYRSTCLLAEMLIDPRICNTTP